MLEVGDKVLRTHGGDPDNRGMIIGKVYKIKGANQCGAAPCTGLNGNCTQEISLEGVGAVWCGVNFRKVSQTLLIKRSKKCLK